MDDNCTIAVLVATYNGERYLKQQLDSILLQTYQNFKIYISDDASSDLTLQLLEQYQKKYPQKIFYSLNNENIGFVNNFEQLIENCTEPYLALCDQDDIWTIDKLELQMKAIGDYEKKYPETALLVHSNLQMIGEDGHNFGTSFFHYRKITLPTQSSVNKIVSHNGVMGCTVLFNKKLKEHILPFPDTVNLHDYWIAVVNEVVGHRITLTECLVKYRIHQTNTSNSLAKIKRKKRSLIEQFFNHDSLPFIGLGREKQLSVLLERFPMIDEKDKKIIFAFISYLEQKSNPFKIMCNLLRYNLIREDSPYRIKVFIKLIEQSYRSDV